jgi:hypothetical protein
MQTKLVFLLAVVLAVSGFAFAQATAEINGRVVDQVQAVAPGATVTVTNVGSGAVRQTVTNAEGLYSVPALTPGNYIIKTELKGFTPAARTVELQIGAVLTVDLQLQVGAVQQSVSVEAQGELIESTQGTIAGSLRTTEVAELPILNRTLSALITLTPGAREVTASTSAHGASSNFVSFGGSAGASYNMQVDGLDNKEDHCGGVEIPYSLEGVQEFKVLNTGSSAEYGKANATVLLATKSGTNQLHGTGFIYGRNQDLEKIDYFSDPVHGGLGKPPFSRVQYGGSLGGAIIKDKLWYFGSVERTQQNYEVPRPGSIINQLNALTTLNVGNYPPLGLAVGGAVPEPSHDLLIQGKVNYQLSPGNSLFFRFSSETGFVNNDFFGATSGLISWANGPSDRNLQNLYGGAMGETWVINNRMVNQFAAQWLGFEHDNKFPVCPYNVPQLGADSCLSETLIFPSVRTGNSNGGFPDFTNIEKKWQGKDDLSIQLGAHALKFGVDAWWAPVFGGVFGFNTPGSLTFFDDPRTIIGNLNGLYPQGFQTPGIVESLLESNAKGGTYFSQDNYGVGLYVQDDFKVSRKVTLNLGLRGDIYNLFNTQANLATNRTYQILKAIGSPYGKLPQQQPFAWEPRVGIAYDPKGNGNDVIRASGGIYTEQQLKNTTFFSEVANQPFLLYSQQLFNSSVGVGQLAHYVYGSTALPPIPPSIQGASFPVSGQSTAWWYDPKEFKNVMSFQYHLGWAHRLSGSSVISVDHTFILNTNGWRWLDVNPFINGVRPLAAAQQALYGGQPIGILFMNESVNRSHYDETQVHYEKRFSAQASFQVNYVLAWANGMGGTTDGTLRDASPYPQQPSATGGNIYAPSEFGPTKFDERHRITAVGVFLLPFKLEVAPSLTFATARPYTLYSGFQPTGDGGEFQVLNSNGNPVGINSQRGQALFILNTRVTRNFKFNERMNMGVFAELYNLTDRANFGNIFGGNQFAPSTYEKPIGYLGGIGAVSSIPNSFQVQFGGRFNF